MIFLRYVMAFVLAVLLSSPCSLYAGPPGFPEATLVAEGYSYNNITTATTTYVKSAPGVLAGILVNGGTMGQITVVDNTATIAGSTIATIAAPTSGQVIPFGIQCSTGIGIVTGDAMNITVIYK